MSFFYFQKMIYFWIMFKPISMLPLSQIKNFNFSIVDLGLKLIPGAVELIYSNDIWISLQIAGSFNLETLIYLEIFVPLYLIFHLVQSFILPRTNLWSIPHSTPYMTLTMLKILFMTNDIMNNVSIFRS